MRLYTGEGWRVLTAIQMAILVAILLGGIAVIMCVLLVAIRREVDALEQAVHCEFTILHDYIAKALSAKALSLDVPKRTRQGYKTRRALIHDIRRNDKRNARAMKLEGATDGV